MKKFVFSLEKLRNYRQLRLDQECGALEALAGQLRHLDTRRRALADDEQRAVASVRALRVIPVQELVALDSYRRWVEQEFHRLDALETELRNKILRQREAVLKARKEVESLTHLRDQKLAGWRADLDKETEAAVAELVVARWGRSDPAG